MRIAQIDESLIDTKLSIRGWIRSTRWQKNFAFMELNDGSRLGNLQVILSDTSLEETLTTGAAVEVTGLLVKSPGGEQSFELQADDVKLIGCCPADDYPLQKKRHSFEFLRTIAHLRPRTNTQGAVLRVRSALAGATHRFFQESGFIYLNTPILTSADCEGGGEQFTVTTLDLENPPKDKTGKVDFKEDFFGKRAYLTVSGQLNAEAVACGLSNVYTFGPTFRAENSHTTRHLAEFWMMEPEMAFATLSDVIDNVEAYVKFVVKEAMEMCSEDFYFFDRMIEQGLLDRLKTVINEPFARLSYTDAIELLLKSGATFEHKVVWGMDLQTEHERYLAEKHFKKPVFITDYPKGIKAFYMRNNEDGKTVAAMDLLVPKIGELVGGSQREERYDELLKKIEENDLPAGDYQWYLDLRKYGTVPHGGYGVGFERLVQFATGMENIRDVSAFPRYPGSINF